MDLTNNALGPRGVNLKSGETHFLEPGETRSFEDGEVADFHAELDKGKGKPLAKMTTAELEEAAGLVGVTFGEDVKTNADRIAAIEAARAA